MKFYEFARSFFRKKLQIRRHFATKCTIRGTRGAKVQADATFSGRSMVEMLGVLAIIGVLSVGAISGYSKAMMKYRLNKQAEAFNMLLANTIQLSGQLQSSDTMTYYHDMLYKLNLLPDGIEYNANIDRLTDLFGNTMLFYSLNKWGYSFGIIFNALKNANGSFEVCQNLMNTAKMFSSELIRVERDDHSSEGLEIKSFYGDNKCVSGVKCLKDLTIEDIYAICAKTDTDNTNYTLGFVW